MDLRRIWFDPPHLRWGRVLATVLIATALVALWVAQRRGLFDDAPERVVPAISPVGSAIAVAAAGRAASAPVAAVAAAAAAVEIVCGLGEVSFDPNDEKQLEALTEEAHEKLRAHRERVLPGWIEEMKSSADAQVQALGWLLEARDAWTARAEGRQPESTEALEELARMAQRSRDPLIYALAFQSCDIYRARAAVPACQSLSVEEWAQRDPGNAFPWLYGMGADRADAQRRSLYAERVLASEAIRSSWGAAYSVLTKAAPPNEATLDHTVRSWEGVSLDSVVSLSPAGVLDYCKENELRQGARRQQCERLATFMTEKSDTVMGAMFGSGIGKRLGWSADRLQRLQAERESLQEQLLKESSLPGCEGQALAEAYFADVAKYGELGALRRRQQAAR